jgi:hypothetical protein
MGKEVEILLETVITASWEQNNRRKLRAEIDSLCRRSLDAGRGRGGFVHRSMKKLPLCATLILLLMIPQLARAQADNAICGSVTGGTSSDCDDSGMKQAIFDKSVGIKGGAVCVSPITNTDNCYYDCKWLQMIVYSLYRSCLILLGEMVVDLYM